MNGAQTNQIGLDVSSCVTLRYRHTSRPLLQCNTGQHANYIKLTMVIESAIGDDVQSRDNVNNDD
jgi:hypothetical protein